MRETNTIIELISERGKKGLPFERFYRLLFNRNLYLQAYGKIARNAGAMTHGVTNETPDGMSLEKIDAIIEAVRYERYEWLPARRVSIPKKNGKKRPLGMPVWSGKLLDAGYMEDWTFHRTLSGVPQGGIVSPLLSNILLDKLDTFVDTTLIPHYTRGKKREDNPEYTKLMDLSLYHRRRGHVEKAEE